MSNVFLIKGKDYYDQGCEWVFNTSSGYRLALCLIRDAQYWKTHRGAERVAEKTGGEVFEMTQEQLDDAIADEKAKLRLHEFLQDKAQLLQRKAHEGEAWKLLWESFELISEFIPGTKVRVYSGLTLDYTHREVERVGEISFWVEGREYSLLDGKEVLLDTEANREEFFALPDCYDSDLLMGDRLRVLFQRVPQEFLFKQGELTAIARILSDAKKRCLGGM